MSVRTRRRSKSKQRERLPPVAADLNPQMSKLFRVPMQDVTLRTDSHAAQRSAGFGALAYNTDREIGFAPGAFDPESQPGRHRLLHEYAHVAQRKGGNRAGPPLADAQQAEQQARNAADQAMAGVTPTVSAFQGSDTLHDKQRAGSKASRTHVFSAAQVERWVDANQDVWFQVFSEHVRRLYPGASEQDIQSAAAGVTDRVLTGDLAGEIRKAKRGNGQIGITVKPGPDEHLRNWIFKEKKVQVGSGDPEKEGGGGEGKGKGKGTGGDGGKGKGGDGGKGKGTGGGEERPLGISKQPGTKVKAKSAAAAAEKLQQELDKAAADLNRVTVKDSDGTERFWPAQYADPKQRELILQVMKDIVGEPPKLPEGEKSKVPVRLSPDEARFLLQIATADQATRDAVIAKLKGSGEIKPDNGMTLAQTLETAYENVELEQHAAELGVEIEKSAPSKDPSKIPIENRPVRGALVNEIGALTVGERAVWKLRVDDDRDAFRVPHIYITWKAVRFDEKTKEQVETVSSENTHHMPVRSQGILNDSEFDFTVRRPGPHAVKAIVRHNFFRPAYFEEPFVVEEEFPQSNRRFDEQNQGLIDKAGGWDVEFFDHGGNFDYRLGRMRRGKLDPKAHPTTDQELIDNLKAQQDEIRDNVARLVTQSPSSREALEEARDARIAELQKQIGKIEATQSTDAKPLVVRGQFTSRVRGIEDTELTLSCTVQERTVTDEDTKKQRTEFLLTMHDGTARASRTIYHWTKQAPSVEGAQRLLFLDIAEAYPFGTVSVLFQGYDHTAHKATRNFVQFQKKTDTAAKDLKSIVFDEDVDTAINLIGFVLSIIPVTAPIGIALLVVYNSGKALAENLDDAETGNFEKKKAYIALGDLVLNLLPLAPKVVKVGKGAYYVIKTTSIAGGVVLMTAVGLQQVRELRTGLIDVLAQKQRRLAELKKTNPAHPEIVHGTLQREIDELIRDTRDATKTVFTQIGGQALFMHVVSTAADVGTGNIKGLSPLERRVLPDADARSTAVGKLKAQAGVKGEGGLVHQDGAKPRYDYKNEKIVVDENTVNPKDLNSVSKEAHVDAKLKQSGVAPKERAEVGKDLAKVDVDIVGGANKTEVVKGSDRPTVKVRRGATADEIRGALKDAKGDVKADPNLSATTFQPPDRPLPGSPADKLMQQVNGKLSPRAKKRHGEVRVEIVPPPGEGPPSKIRADLRYENGRPVLRFEGEPRPGVLAEELAHLEQLADPKFARQRAQLAATEGKPWHGLSDAKKVDAHRSRLELEADAQKRVIADLERQLKSEKKVSVDDPRAVDIDNAYQNLEQLRAKLEALNGLRAELEAHGGFASRPEALDTPPQLTNRRTTDKFPLADVGNWKKMTEGQFVKAYKDRYPDTSLTDLELRQRYRNGQRLNPASGRKKDPTLIDNPTPDVPAKVKAKETIDVKSLKISKDDQKKIDALLAERDKHRKARDKARDDGDEATAAQHGAKVNEASRKLGEAHAEAYMRENYPDYQRLYPSDPNKPSRSGDFDQVWVKRGKPKGGKALEIEVIVIEAKGGSSPLGVRKTAQGIAQQGTRPYFDAIASEMVKAGGEAEEVGKLLRKLSISQISYKVVRAPIEMSADAKPRSVVVKIQVGDFDIGAAGKKKK